MGTGQRWFAADGLAVVVDCFVQLGFDRGEDAERVPGRGPLGVIGEGLPVISDRLDPGFLAEGAEGSQAARRN